MAGTDFNVRNQQYAQALAARQAGADKAATSDSDSSFGFSDLLDIVNPLQHIPVISTIYRHLTGDKIGTPEKIIGDTLYGGWTGLLFSVGDAVFTNVTGKSVGDTVYTALLGDDHPTTGVAANDNQPPSLADSAPIRLATNLPSDDDTPFTLATPAQASPLQVASAYRASGRLLEAY